MELRSCPVPTRTNLTEVIRRIGVTNLESGPWVAGGAARSVFLGEELRLSGDIDIFTRTFESQHEALVAVVEKAVKVNDRKKNTHGTESLYASFEAVHGGFVDLKWQIIGPKYYSKDLPDLFKIFDFTVCQFATDGHTIVYTPEAEHDARRNILALSKHWTMTTRPARITRYLNYGFTPEQDFFVEAYKLDARIMQKDLTFKDGY